MYLLCAIKVIFIHETNVVCNFACTVNNWLIEKFYEQNSGKFAGAVPQISLIINSRIERFWFYIQPANSVQLERSVQS